MNAQPKSSIPRSPAGLLSSQIPVPLDDRLGTSPSGQSALSSSSASTPNHMHESLKRRSTGTSGGLDDYYFSAYAGVGGSSSTSSLSMSPGPSHDMMFGSSPTPSMMDVSRGPSRQSRGSFTNLRNLIHEEEEAQTVSSEQFMSRLPRPPYSQYTSDHRMGEPGPSSGNGRMQITTQSSDESRLHPLRQDSLDNQISPGGYSHSSASHYSSSVVSSDNESFGFDVNGRAINGLMGTSDAMWSRSTSRIDMRDVRESVDSSITVMSPNLDDAILPNQQTTPIPPPHDERFHDTPQNVRYPTSHLSPRDYNGTASPGSTSDRTPTLGGPVMSSGRLTNVAHPDSSKSSLALSDASTQVRGTTRPLDTRREEPRSAPPTQTEFGINMSGEDEEGEETVKGRKRSTLPPTSFSGLFSDTLLSPDKESRPSSDNQSDPDPSPSKSPQPPPRSTLRPQTLFPSPARSSSSFHGNGASIDENAVSPKSRHKALPTIINTDSSPQRPEVASQAMQSPSRPERSPTRSVSSINSSATINDLTEMLGGAIDAIGLIDSRDTPPPTVTEPKKDRGLSVPTLAAAAELIEPPRTLLPARGASLPGSAVSTLPLPRYFTQPTRRLSDNFETPVNEQHMIQGVPTARPWPAAMMYGSIKRLRAPGDRAKGYAKAINELARAESGLREWCTASIEHAYRPVAPQSRKASTMEGLGVKSPVLSTMVPEPTHPRQVSSGSEFPMRADSYTAREISTRLIDPHDQPTALPQNLPYPQLQQQYQSGGGMKPSPSMQSMASVSSKKSFFSAAIGRIGGKKENYSLGPPSGQYQSQSAGAATKRDVKGLAISGPSYSHGETPLGPRPSTTGSAPMGPRNPRGSYTPPTMVNLDRASAEISSRASLDQGLARMSSGRASLDSPRQGKMSAPPRSSPMGLHSPTVGASGGVRDDDMRQMVDVLPHVERGVLRMYLQRHHDPMRAIGAYIEDEKRGAVPR